MPRLPAPIRQRCPHATQRMRSASRCQSSPGAVWLSITSASVGLTIGSFMNAAWIGPNASNASIGQNPTGCNSIVARTFLSVSKLHEVGQECPTHKRVQEADGLQRHGG